MKILLRQCDLSDEYIRFAQQIGADGIDIHNARSIPGFMEQGYPDLEALRAIKQRINDAGLGLYRVAPPDDCSDFMLGKPGGERDIENLLKTIEILGQLRIPFLSTPIHFGNPGHRGGVVYEKRGGYKMGGFSVDKMNEAEAREPWQPQVSIEDHWRRSVEMLKALVPVAERCDVKLITHPSDPPMSNAHVSPQRWTDLMEAVPSCHNGLLYCVGTRYESGVDIFDDIRFYGRKGWIFHTHLRNVKGQIPTHGGYQEVAMDDGDMDMLEVLQTLREVGFDGGLQLDHMPTYDADGENRMIAWAFAVGYVRALIASL
jgi:mannonate dehydratase